jgi:pimeloyl-ACP methyl ester carboxylesterase
LGNPWDIAAGDRACADLFGLSAICGPLRETPTNCPVSSPLKETPALVSIGGHFIRHLRDEHPIARRDKETLMFRTVLVSVALFAAVLPAVGCRNLPASDPSASAPVGSAAAAPAVAASSEAAVEAKATGSRVAINGMQLYYEVSGQGDPLIVLHGAYMNIPSMGAIIPKLAKTHKIYALELQGHGRTTDIDRPITYLNMANDVAAFMDAVGLPKADVFGYSMGSIVGLQLAIRHPAKVGKLAAASVAYDVEGWQPEFKIMIPQLSVEMLLDTPFAKEYPQLAANPNGFPELARKLIALEKEPMAWAKDVKALKLPVLIITSDYDVATLEHSVAMFRLLGGAGMGDMGKPLPPVRLAVLPATSHTAVITQPDLLHAFIEPFLKGETPKGMF